MSADITTTVHYDHDNSLRIVSEAVNGVFPAGFGHATSVGAVDDDD